MPKRRHISNRDDCLPCYRRAGVHSVLHLLLHMFGIIGLCGLRLDDATLPGVERSLEHLVESAHWHYFDCQDPEIHERAKEGMKERQKSL